MRENPRAEVPRGRLARLADLAYRRRGTIVVAWLLLLAAVIAVAPRLAGEWDADYSTPGSESEAAANLVAERFPGESGDTIEVVWEAPSGARSPEVEERMERFLARASSLEGIGDAGQPRVSPDGAIALVRLELDRRSWDVPLETPRELIRMAEAASGDGLRIKLGGGPIRDAEGETSPEAAGLAAAAVILLVAFGSLVAAGLPLVAALFGLGISAPLIGVLAGAVAMPEWAPAVAGLIGIGVGIDYALLILTRFRAALRAGTEPRAAVVEAVSTAGRSTLVAGTTVVISVLGLALVGVSYLQGVAAAASLSVLVVMLASVTLVPAIVAFAGRRVDRLRVPGLGRTLTSEAATPAARWSRAVQKRPWTAALAGAAVLIALTLPVLGLRLGFPDAGNNRQGTTTRDAYDLVREGFGPGANGPLLVAAELPRPQSAREMEDLAARIRAEPGVAFVTEPRFNPSGDAAVLTVVPAASPQDDATGNLVRRLRDEVVPQALTGNGIEAHVGGITASFLDQSMFVAGRLPLVIGAVLGLSFLLLLAAFRAPLVALKAGVMNLLSIGAAYGAVAFVAEGGVAGELIGIEGDTPVPPFIPVMMFAVLFGLSMDYEVFLLSRVREEYLRSGQASDAVAAGLAKTARVITAAAAIMVAVFLAFVFSQEVFLKLLGVGMATAVFVDATLVRMVLVPALMQLLGRANWWIPGWLDRALPRLDVEPAPEPAES